MRYVEDEAGKRIEISAGLDDEEIMVAHADGFAAKDIYIGGGHLTWAELDELKAAIADAERRWRNSSPNRSDGDT